MLPSFSSHLGMLAYLALVARVGRGQSAFTAIPRFFSLEMVLY